MKDGVEKLIIVGSGPAGLTAAIYAARGSLDPLVVAGQEAGGQLILTTDVDDFPGFPEGIPGPDLITKMRQQASKFDTRFINEDVVAIDLKTQPFHVKTESRSLLANSLVIASGASAKWLGLSSELRLIGKGVSACAVCDAPFFKGKDVIVVGGGDTAMREAQHLSKVARQVSVVVRREALRAQAVLQELVTERPNVNFIFNNVIEDILGKNKVEAAVLKNTKTGKISKLPIDAVFVAIGHSPNTAFLKGQLKLDGQGYIIVSKETRTSVEGVFVAGDVADYRYRQAVTAAGSGCKAAMDAAEYLEYLKLPADNSG